MVHGIKRLAILAALSTVACGATTPDPEPVFVPQSSGAPVTQTAPVGPTEVNSSQRGVIPAGQELDVRLQTTLSSETATAEQRFETTTAVDIMQDGQVLIPAGSVVRGRTLPIRGMATQVFESGGIRDEVGTAGAGAGVGGVIGGLLGGVKGAVLGAVIGAGGAIAATEGKDVHLPAGSVIRIRLDSPVTVR
jgi:hypothetical protein